MRLLLIDVNLHHKNRNGLDLLKNVAITRVSLNEFLSMTIQANDYDCVFSPGVPVDVQKYPGVRFLFGPHFSIFPDERMNIIKGLMTTYVVPSEWTKRLYDGFTICDGLHVAVLPFAVDVNKFTPTRQMSERNCVFVYHKSRTTDELNAVCNELSKRGIAYNTFRYGSYDERDYLEYLRKCKWGVWVGAHESQGFALQEALAMDIPLFVWNVRCLSQEHGRNNPKYEATTISYWDDRCGEAFHDQNEIPSVMDVFLEKVGEGVYSPRNFVLEHLSPDACERKLAQVVSSI